MGKTHDAEMAKLVPVGTDKSNAEKKIVLQLEPSDLPKLEPGDDLTTPCELELTTAADIGQGDYDPHVDIQILLGADKNDKQGPEIDRKKDVVLNKKPRGKVFLNVVGVKDSAGANTSPRVTIKGTTFKVDRYDK